MHAPAKPHRTISKSMGAGNSRLRIAAFFRLKIFLFLRETFSRPIWSNKYKELQENSPKRSRNIFSYSSYSARTMEPS